MRISPVLFLLPVLVLTGSAAIANNDRPTSPQPAIASPIAAPLTIESLAGTYKGVVEEKALKEMLSDMKRSVNMPVEKLETNFRPIEAGFRQLVEQKSITIYADGTFEAKFINNGNPHGRVKLNGNKLIFIDVVAELNDRANGSIHTPGCNECYRFMLYASADGKTLLVDRSINPPQTLIHGFVKQ